MGKQIIMDSACDLPDEYLHNIDHKILPYRINFNGKEYKAGSEITLAEVYSRMRDGVYPKTSQVSPQDFKEAFLEAARAQKDCLYLAFSAAMSGSYQTARLVAGEVKEKYPDFNVEIVDSKSGSLAIGLLVKQAVDLLDQGLSIQQIGDQLREAREKVVHIFSLDDLTALQRGGRLSRGRAIVGNVLNIKPILEVEDGEIVLARKARGKKRMLRAILKKIKKQGSRLGDQIIGISHAGDPETAAELKDKIKAEFDPAGFMETEINAVLGVHLGIGGIGVFFFSS